MSLYLVNVQYAATERTVIEAATPREAEDKATAHFRLMDGDPAILDVGVIEVVPVEQTTATT